MLISDRIRSTVPASAPLAAALACLDGRAAAPAVAGFGTAAPTGAVSYRVQGWMPSTGFGAVELQVISGPMNDMTDHKFTLRGNRPPDRSPV